MTTSSKPAEHTESPVVDKFGRPVKSLRLSVTQRCDLDCDFCHKEGQSPSQDEMSPEEIERLMRVAASLGVRKVKITGGEPLIREDIREIITRISPLMSEVSLTTNGHRLGAIARDLKSAGLSRVNVSLHTLDPAVYRNLCGSDGVESVVGGIEESIKAGLRPVKVNMVVLRGINETEIPQMMEFCARTGAILQLIEFETSKEDAGNGQFRERYFSLKDTESEIAGRAEKSAHNELHRRGRYTVMTGGGVVEVEFVRPMHNTEFCRNCTRIRLSSDGRMKPCLMDKRGELDALGALRNGASDSELRELFLKVVASRRPYWS